MARQPNGLSSDAAGFAVALIVLLIAIGGALVWRVCVVALRALLALQEHLTRAVLAAAGFTDAPTLAVALVTLGLYVVAGLALFVASVSVIHIGALVAVVAACTAVGAVMACASALSGGGRSVRPGWWD